MNLATIPVHAPFLDTLAARWLAAHGADHSGHDQTGDDQTGHAARGLILLPTRRAARALAEAFLRATGGRPLLLPRITALGALDETPLALIGALDLPPAVAPMQRLAVLSRLIMALPEADGGVRGADRAWMLARELALLMDEAERAELDLPRALSHAAEAEHARHWEATLRFLAIVTTAWPDWLAEQGLINPAARQIRLLRAQTAAWEATPPSEPVWIAGTTGGIAAVAALLRQVARLPNGMVVLPGLDLDLPESAWDQLDESHPQAGLRRLLAGLGAARGDVSVWDGPAAPDRAGRAALLSRALLPAGALSAWRAPFAADLAGLWRLDTADQQEEAAAIALVLRDALERPGARAALVTPDRGLAGRVAAELLRWGVVADDSAGERLADTPQAVFLRLLAEAVAARLAPVPLLALLKHPLAAAGLSPAACRDAARTLERTSLRGPRPVPGLAGLRRRVATGHPAATDLLARLETCLDPLLRAAASAVAAPQDLLTALITAAEALAASDSATGPARLWAQEEGEALAVLLTEARAALTVLPEQPPSGLPGLLDALLEGATVRGRRALRGREAGQEHPRVVIWGLLEARLQAVDVIVLGGLAETIWPPAPDPGPWMSRPMRARAGLPSPEEQVGQAAHDFVAAACAAPLAVLSCPRRRDAAPAVPARWLARLDALLAGQATAGQATAGQGTASQGTASLGTRLPAHPAAAWVRALDLPLHGPRPVRPPRPSPPVALRPRHLSVTEIQTWLEDPYAIYARHVLNLRKLEPLEQATDAADYGSLVHDGLKLFLDEVGHHWPVNAPARLREKLELALRQAELRPALAEWWTPRLHRIADWVCAQELDRRCRSRPLHLAVEKDGAWQLHGPAGPFELRGRADRIERHEGGRLAILDYKTGTPPSQKSVAAGFAPQLPLEAAMAAAGAFGPELAGATAELIYWHLTGGFEPGEARPLYNNDADQIAAAVTAAAANLRALIAEFDSPDRAYLSQPHPGRPPRFPDYAQLARVAEWDLSGDAE